MRHRTVAHGETLVCVAFLLSFPNREQIPFFKPTLGIFQLRYGIVTGLEMYCLFIWRSFSTTTTDGGLCAAGTANQRLIKSFEEPNAQKP